jgi:ferredoxin
MAELVYLRDVVTLRLDRKRCVGCGTCETVCPHPVLALEDRRAKIVNRDACMECGACATNCAAEAITVKAGVGCAAAVINAAIGRHESACCAS